MVCHDLMQKTMNSNDVAIVSVKGSDYRIHRLTFIGSTFFVIYKNG